MDSLMTKQTYIYIYIDGIQITVHTCRTYITFQNTYFSEIMQLFIWIDLYWHIVFGIRLVVIPCRSHTRPLLLLENVEIQQDF